MDLKGINNIIFDLGGVILNIDTQKTISRFQELFGKDFAGVYDHLKENQLFQNFEKGRVSAGTFRQTLKKHAIIDVDDEMIDMAWNAMILDIPPQNLELLKNLKNQYRTFLLSNTNEIHINHYNQMLQEAYGYEDMSAFFEKDHYSHLLDARKPDVNIYKKIMQLHGLTAHETLFIDDFIENVQAAKKAGMKTYHMQENDRLTDLFPNI